MVKESKIILLFCCMSNLVKILMCARCDRIQFLPNDSQLVIDATRAGFVDADILETISDFTETAKTKNIVIDINGLKLPDKILS